jgi:hypothetical protein
MYNNMQDDDDTQKTRPASSFGVGKGCLLLAGIAFGSLVISGLLGIVIISVLG